MTPLTLAFGALVVLFIAAVALCGFLYLLLTERHHQPDRDPEPPGWVNDGRPCHQRPRRGNWRERCNT